VGDVAWLLQKEYEADPNGTQSGRRGFPKAACQLNPGLSNWTAPKQTLLPTSAALCSSFKQKRPWESCRMAMVSDYFTLLTVDKSQRHVYSIYLRLVPQLLYL
jgi:hypothetical protein